jgi:hypothetical protein
MHIKLKYYISIYMNSENSSLSFESTPEQKSWVSKKLVPAVKKVVPVVQKVGNIANKIAIVASVL